MPDTGVSGVGARVAALPARQPATLFRHRSTAAYAFLAPALAGLLLFYFFPILFALWISFHEWNMLTPVAQMPWAGVANYVEVLTRDTVFPFALRNTLLFAALGVSINTVLGLSLALALNTRLRLQTFWRTVYFLPVVTAPIALAIIWTLLFNRNFGLINNLLGLVGIPPQPFFAHPKQALASLITVAVHQYVGFYVVIFLAGLQGIPEEYYDSAKVDGANSWQSFWHITLPLLRPVLLFIVVINTIGALQVFDLVFATTGGGPANSTQVVVFYMYQTAFKFWRMGKAAAMAFVLLAIILALTLVQLRLLRQKT